MALVGDVKDLPLPDIIQINCLGRNVARLLVRYPVGDGVFYFQDGEIYDARLGELSGVKAIYEALKYEEGAFRIDASVTTSERTIFKSWAEVLMDGLRYLDEQNAGISPSKSYANFNPDDFLTRQTQGIPVIGKQNKDYIGKIVNDKYRVVRKIKEGELGTMYQATHIQMDVSVAIKIMHPYLVTDQAAVERFRRGAHAAAKIHHPNAISVLDFGITRDDIVYLAMEYLEGETFRERLQRQKKIIPKEMLKILKPVCSALEAAHRDQIVHRDLKPENIMIYESAGEELVKVLDFGMAKLKSLGTEGVLTSHGLMLGTHSYMSPELCEGVDIDNRSDVYALGIIIYEALTGSLPFNDPTPVGMALKHIGSRPSSPRILSPELSENVEKVLMKALEKRPEARQQSALELAKEFEQALSFKGFPSNLPKTKPVSNLANSFASEPFITQSVPEIFSGELRESRSRVPGTDPFSPPNKFVNDPQVKRPNTSENPVGKVPSPNPTNLEAKPLENKAKAEQIYPKTPSVNPIETIENNLQPDNVVRVEPIAVKKKSSLVESNLFLFFLSALIAGTLFLMVFLIWQYFKGVPQTSNTNKSFLAPQMIKIQGASFRMGRDEDKDVPLVETPSHEITVKDFFLSRFEITNKEYQEFVIDANYRPPLGWGGTELAKGTENLPIVNITWEDANYYCQWLSKVTKENYRLPTEDEWEFAARGTENRLYPWGNSATSTVFASTSLGLTSPVNSASLLADRSPFEIVGLAGNVSEWTSSLYQPYPGSTSKIDCSGCYTVRGGNFKSQPNELVSTFRRGSKKASELIGFRVARD
ncbi:MAG: SUMF1/EgtB/PvdO family nonheme iron enzyme [Acidobacteria bacterium]|nr:SUMF1/EgtB/PvdO family nonheme iron enzyme [Acidobacteriota bacterium]